MVKARAANEEKRWIRMKRSTFQANCRTRFNPSIAYKLFWQLPGG